MKTVAVLNLNITYQRKGKQRKKGQKKYKRYYDNDDKDDFNDDIDDSASESNEKSDNFDDDHDDDDDVNANYRKTPIKQRRNKKKKGISNYLNKQNLTKFYH